MNKLLVVLLVLLPLDALATNVRGRVDFALAGGMVPMNGAAVALCVPGSGCVQYRTGPDGMYYFNVPPGNYVLQVNAHPPLPVFVPNLPYVDLAPVRGN